MEFRGYEADAPPEQARAELAEGIRKWLKVAPDPGARIIAARRRRTFRGGESVIVIFDDRLDLDAGI